MAKRKAKLEEGAVSVPLSSMIDVVFLLLIYFIVTQKPVIEDVHLMVDLPAPSNPPKEEQMKPLNIDVYKQPGDNVEDIDKLLKGEKNERRQKQILEGLRMYYAVNGSPIESKRLLEYLQNVAKSAPDTTVVITCGPNAKHRKLIYLLDMCSKAELTKLNLAKGNDITFRQDPIEVRTQ